MLHAVDHQTVADLSVVNSLALSLIALAGGAELRLEAVRRGFRSLVAATVVQNGLALLVIPATFVLARDLVPFTRGMEMPAVFAVALLWGVVAITRSPSAVMGILSQTRPAGRLTDFTVGFVMTSDVVVVVVLALVDDRGPAAARARGHPLAGRLRRPRGTSSWAASRSAPPWGSCWSPTCVSWAGRCCSSSSCSAWW